MFSTAMLPTRSRNSKECRYEQQSWLKHSHLIRRFNVFGRKMSLALLLLCLLINFPQRVAARPQDLAEYNNADHTEKNNSENNYDLDTSDSGDYHHDSNLSNQNEIIVGDQEQQDEIADLSDKTKAASVHLATTTITPAPTSTTVEQQQDSEDEFSIEPGEELTTSTAQPSKELSTTSFVELSEELSIFENESSKEISSAETGEELPTLTAEPSEKAPLTSTETSTVGIAEATLRHDEQVEPVQVGQEQEEDDKDATTTAVEEQPNASIEESSATTTREQEKNEPPTTEKFTSAVMDESASEETGTTTEGIIFVVGEETTTLSMESIVTTSNTIQKAATAIIDETTTNTKLLDHSEHNEEKLEKSEENEEYTITGITEEAAATSTTEPISIEEVDSTSEPVKEATKTLPTNQETTFITTTDANSIGIESNAEEFDSNNVDAEETTSSSNEHLISETSTTIDLNADNDNADFNERKEDSTTEQQEATTTMTTTSWTVQQQQHQQYTQQWWTTTTTAGVRRSRPSRITQTCADGRLPEYSVYGGTYCWSDAVCPRVTVCVQNQCCYGGGGGNVVPPNAETTTTTTITTASEPADEFPAHDGELLASSASGHPDEPAVDDNSIVFAAVEEGEVVTLEPSTSNEADIDAKTMIEASAPSDTISARAKRRFGALRHHHRHPQPCGTEADEFRCLSSALDNALCVSAFRVCDAVHDCDDGSDEADCENFDPAATENHLEKYEFVDGSNIVNPSTPQDTTTILELQKVKRRLLREHYVENPDGGSSSSGDLQITVYPHELTVREGRDATFECRARSSDNVAYPEVRWTRVGGRLPDSAHASGSGVLTLHPTHLSDSGRYACVAMHQGRTVEAYALLHVQSYGPQEFQAGGLADGASAGCMADEKACASKQCVKADYVCDGEPDCADRSDEMNCPNKRRCEPNEFRCNNDQCIQKMWLCDGDDDCGDSSDEQNCGERRAGDLCQPTEFRCADQRQCVPQSFQCDGTNDCQDGSDEVGCVQPTVVQAPDSNKVIRQGDNFKLTCRAVAVPEPYINWRLNWGPVCEPPRCQQQSEGGVGTLSIQNAQPVDQGAYTCEAINVKGRVLATPDCIVRIVNIPAPQPPPPAPPQPRLTCHQVGAVQPQTDTRGQCQCKPNVDGPTCGQCSPGSFNLNDRAPQGCMSCFCFGITNQCRSSQYFRTKEKLFFGSGDAQGVQLANAHGDAQPASSTFDFEQYGFISQKEPSSGDGETLYWKMPTQFLGDKVTAYGGHLSFQLQYEGSGPVRAHEPLVVLKGNGITIVHRAAQHNENTFPPSRPVPVQVPTYEFSYEHQSSGAAATREDLMMVLADLDEFLIRATHVDDHTSTSLGEVSWETAVPHDTQDVRALEVEECSCPHGYVGPSCQDCTPGYERSGHGPYLGTCVPARRPPPPPAAVCSPHGAIHPQPLGADQRCQCRQNTVGATCDRCAPGSYHLAPSNPQGCLKCFCSGVTNQCRSSSLQRAPVELDYGRGANTVLELSTSDARTPFRPPTQAQIYDGALHFDALSEAQGETLYWKLPAEFLGDKITAYGGHLKYAVRGSTGTGPEPDVIIRGNDITLHHKASSSPSAVAAGELDVQVPIVESEWQRSDGQPATREHLMMALADLEDCLIKAGDSSSESATLTRISFEHAVNGYEAPPGAAHALEVEECECPVGYVGTSCEDCAPGYSRTGGGLYLGLCEKCECHSHASQCDAEYGACVNCQHNTEGDQCERCRPGFVGDARRGTPTDCQPEADTQQRPSCQCYNHSPRGCDSFGRCLLCEHNTEGYHCETCKKGFYGDATRGTPFDCTPCPCPGASDCFLDQSGQVQCRNCPAGFAGRLCDECAPGYTRSQTSGGRDCEPIGRVHPDRIQFVPNPEVQLHVEILPPKHLSIQEGGRAKWTCKVSESFKPEDVEITWTKIGHHELPATVRQYGNQLIIDAAQMLDAGQYRCTGTSRIGPDVATDDASLVVAPTRRIPPAAPQHPIAAQTQTPRPIVTPPHQTVDENQQAVFTCLTPGFTDCEVEWHFNEIGGPLPNGVYKRGNQVFIPSVQQHHAGNYICSVYHQFGRSESNPGRLDINRGAFSPQVDPPEHNVEVGDPARFRCWVPGVHDAVLEWRPANSAALPAGAEQRDGFLNFPRADLAHSGEYVCAASDPQRGVPPVDSPPVRLNVRQPPVEITPHRHDVPTPQVDPPYQTVDPGQPARFRCWVPDDPNAQLRWTTHATQPLPAGAIEHPHGVLEFPSVAEAHSGAYVCNVYDPNSGRQIPSSPVQLNVRRPQKPLVDPPEQVVSRGEPSRIRCWVPGADPAQLQLRWQARGGAPLPTGAYDDGRGNLAIHETNAEHEGDYECTASDPRAGGPPQVSDPARITLQPIEQKQIQPWEESETGGPPRPVATPPLLTVKRGESARFHCDANSPTPDSEIHWGFGPENGPLRGDAVQHGDDVVIGAADDVDAGEYVCTATNRFGTGRAEPVRLVITDNEEPPTARVEPKIWNGKPGEHHQFKCHVTGVPTPTITWRGPGGNGLPADVVDLGDGVLEISNARKEHEGDYTCHAVNDVGEASDFGTINVGPSLSVRTDPAGPRIVLTVGEALEIKCEAFGDPDPDVEWLHDPGPERGDLPDDFVPVTISEQFIRHPKIGLGNAGRYTCKGSNQFASVTKDIYIEVIEPSHLATVAVLGGSNQWFPIGQPAQLVCASSGSSLVDRLEWTRDGSKDNLPPETNEQTAEQSGLLNFETFKASDEGEYECNAYRKDDLIATTKVNIYSDANLRPDVIHVEISPPTVRVVNKGDSIVLDCVVHGHSSDEFTYVWSLARGGSLIRHLGTESQLNVKDADPTNDYGIYRCEVENDEKDSVGAAQVAVAVSYDPETKPLEAKFDEQSEASLTCPVFIVPGATVSWTKLDEELPENAHQEGNALVIDNFDDLASGVYTCNVQYGQSSVSGYVHAKIFVPDTTIKVVLNASAESVQVGERAWLDCIVVGDTNAKIEFLKDDADALPENAQITQCDDLSQYKNVTGNRLLFTSIAEENSGKYRCKATTSEGPLETSAFLNVEAAKRKRKDLPESAVGHHIKHNHKQDHHHKHYYHKRGEVYYSADDNDASIQVHRSALKHHHHHHRTGGSGYRFSSPTHSFSSSTMPDVIVVRRRGGESHKELSGLSERESHAALLDTLSPTEGRRLREQQLRRRRQRIAAARRHRHRMLQERMARERDTKAAMGGGVDEQVQVETLSEADYRAASSNHPRNQKKYNHYDVKANGDDKVVTIDEEFKPAHKSIFGSWFNSN